MEKGSLNRKKVGRRRLSTTASQKDMVDLQTEIQLCCGCCIFWTGVRKELFHLPWAGSGRCLVLSFHTVMVQAKKRATGSGQLMQRLCSDPTFIKGLCCKGGLGRFATHFYLDCRIFQLSSFPCWFVMTIWRNLENYWVFVFANLAFNDGVSRHINAYRGHVKHRKKQSI